MFREDQLRSLFEGRSILLAGYGREGHSAERLIGRYTAHLSIADGEEEIRQKASLQRYDWVVKSPGVPMRVLKGVEHVTSLTDIFLQVYADRTIGVTGTKGKSTTASLIHHLLPGSLLAGNIGIPLFDIVEQVDEHSLVVAELSCHQLEVLHRSPHIGVVLNLFQEHLDHYDSYLAYQMAKMQIALHQSADDHFFFCSDNDTLESLVDRLPLPSTLHPYRLSLCTSEERQLLDNLLLPGEHNRSNALVAIRVARLAAPSLSAADIEERLESFVPLHHRLERVAQKCGITWYDDSISTLPAATIAALRALPRVDTLILGGFDRGIDYAPLADYLSSHPVPNMVYVGTAGRRIRSLMPPSGSSLVEDDYAKLVPWCADHTPQGGVVLLSPAAASYDAFRNFEHRGDFFRQQIESL